MDWLKPELEHINSKLDRLDNKLDAHLERISKSEEAIVWLKGHVKIVTTIGISAIGSIIAGIIKYFNP